MRQLFPWLRFREQKPWAEIPEVDVLVLVLVGGLFFAFGTVNIDYTSTIAFCASCPSCTKTTKRITAMPHAGVKAASDVFRHFAVRIAPKEEIEEHRPNRVKLVWLRMKETHSQEPATATTASPSREPQGGIESQDVMAEAGK